MPAPENATPFRPPAPPAPFLQQIGAFTLLDWLEYERLWRNRLASAAQPGLDWRDYIVPVAAAPPAPGPDDPQPYNPMLDGDGNVVAEPPAPPPPPAPTAAFSDSFDGPGPGPGWAAVGGTWVQSGGVLSQTGMGSEDPQKMMAVGPVPATYVEVAARVRVDQWTGGDRARAGLSVSQGADGGGYNFVFRDNSIQFLDDFTAWGTSSIPYAWKPGVWYWMKLRRDPGALSGKVWPDSQPEPTGWLVTQPGWDRRGPGAAGLNGGSGGCRASFDDFSVTPLGGEPQPVIPAPAAADVPVDGWSLKGTSERAIDAVACVWEAGSGACAMLGITPEQAVALLLWEREVVSNH